MKDLHYLVLKIYLLNSKLIADPRKITFPKFDDTDHKLLQAQHCGQHTKQVRPSLYARGGSELHNI